MSDDDWVAVFMLLPFGLILLAFAFQLLGGFEQPRRSIDSYHAPASSDDGYADEDDDDDPHARWSDAVERAPGAGRR